MTNTQGERKWTDLELHQLAGIMSSATEPENYARLKALLPAASAPAVAGGTIGLDGDTKQEEMVCRKHDVYYDPDNKSCVICELRAKAAQPAALPTVVTGGHIPEVQPTREALIEQVAFLKGEIEALQTKAGIENIMEREGQ